MPGRPSNAGQVEQPGLVLRVHGSPGRRTAPAGSVAKAMEARVRPPYTSRQSAPAASAAATIGSDRGDADAAGDEEVAPRRRPAGSGCAARAPGRSRRRRAARAPAGSRRARSARAAPRSAARTGPPGRRRGSTAGPARRPAPGRRARPASTRAGRRRPARRRRISAPPRRPPGPGRRPPAPRRSARPPSLAHRQPPRRSGRRHGRALVALRVGEQPLPQLDRVLGDGVRRRSGRSRAGCRCPAASGSGRPGRR